MVLKRAIIYLAAKLVDVHNGVTANQICFDNSPCNASNPIHLEITSVVFELLFINMDTNM